MIDVDDILRRTSTLLLDQTFIRWTKPEQLDWIYDAMTAIIVRNPGSIAALETVVLSEGVKHTLEADGIMDVIRVLPSGRPLSLASRYHLDTADPDWYGKKPTSKLIHYTYDERAENIIYTYPPAADGTEVEVLSWRIPTAKPTEGGTIDIGLEYINAVVNFVVFRALSKDSEYGNGQIAAGYYNLFNSELGAESSAATTPPKGEP